MKATRIVAGLAGLALATSASLLGTTAAHAASPAAPAQPTGTITVLAAASLRDVFPVIAQAFQKRHPGTEVTFSFAGSSALVNQVINGAPADVLATAAESTMQTAVKAGVVGTPLLFARNTMAIAVPRNNPAGIRSLADLARPGVKVGVCAPQVPCGAAARELFAKNGVSVTPVTLALDVRTLLNQVISGDLDAGIVYVTDVKAKPNRVSSVLIPAASNATTTYPIAPVTTAPNPVTARAFVNYVRYTISAQGILRAWGFAKPW